MERILDYFGVKSKVDYGEDDDKVDRLNHRHTVVLFVLFAVIVSTKTFVGEPISCWTPNQFSGAQVDYVNSYCWIKNTYYLPNEESVPKENEEKENVVTYYQWTPLIMLIEALCFYLPYAIWNRFSIKSGLDLNSMVEAGSKLNATEMAEVREKTLKYMTTQMDRYLANIQTDKKHLATISIKRLECMCRCLEGAYLYTFFIFIKVLYFLNAIVQFIILSQFLGGSFFLYGYEMVASLLSGNSDSLIYLRFPRVTMCDFKVRRLGNIHRYTVQCVLTINNFNEKIFFFIWIWLLVVNLANLLSLFLWSSRMIRTSSRESYVSRHISYVKNLPEMEKMLANKRIKQFVDYLKADGIFILYLLTINADTIAVTDFIEALARNFMKKKSLVHKNKEVINDMNFEKEEDDQDAGKKKNWMRNILPNKKSKKGELSNV